MPSAQLWSAVPKATRWALARCCPPPLRRMSSGSWACPTENPLSGTGDLAAPLGHSASLSRLNLTASTTGSSGLGKGQPGSQDGLALSAAGSGVTLSTSPLPLKGCAHGPLPILGRNWYLAWGQLPALEAQASPLLYPEEGLATGGGMVAAGERHNTVAQHHPRPFRADEPPQRCFLHPRPLQRSWQCGEGAPQDRRGLCLKAQGPNKVHLRVSLLGVSMSCCSLCLPFSWAGTEIGGEWEPGK